MKRTGSFLLAMLICATVTSIFFYNRARAATTYTWNQTGTASWALDTNWTPARTSPAVDDILVFNNAATTIVTSVPTQTIGQLIVSNNTNVTLQPAAGVLILTIAGAAGSDLVVNTGTALNISGGTTNTNTLKLLLSAGATASIDGSMTFSTAQHQLDAADASAITFSSGSIFTYNPGANAGNPFTGAGTANAVVFASGAIYVFQGGANPFGLAQPASKVVFQSGSLFRQTGTGTPAFSGRTYANFELNNAAANITVTGGSSVFVNNVTITAGTFNFNMTGTPGHSIKGNISVASGATLNFNPATPGQIAFNGVGGQSISNSGTLTTSANQTFVVVSSSSVTLNNAFTLAGTMNVNSGGTLATGATFTNNGTTTINGTFRLHSSGSALGNAFTYGAGSTLIYFGTGTSQTSTNIEWPAANGPTNVTINNSSGLTLHAARAITGTLDLLDGILTSGGLLSMANGSQITKSNGDMTGTPQGAGTYNVAYSGMLKPTGSELDGAGLTNVTVDMNSSQLLVLNGTKTVPGVLALTNGMVSTGPFTLVLGPAGTVTRNTGFVLGNLRKTFNAAGPLTFEVGTMFAYSPLAVNATAGTFPANFIVSATAGKLPQISGTNALGRYWTLTNSTVTSANLTLNYPSGDVVGNPALYQFIKHSGGTLTTLAPTGTPTTTSATINGVTSFSDWTLAEPSAIQAGSLQFSSGTYSSSETNADHVFSVPVNRVGGADGNIALTYTVTDGSATTADNDYSISPASGTLNWNAGDSSAKNVDITIKGDTNSEPDETVNIAIASPTNSASLGTPNTAVLTITNDDAGAADYNVTTTATTISVSDVSGNGDLLSMTEPVGGSIQFAASLRTFSVNGGAPIAGNSGPLSLSGINAITVNQNAGNDTLSVGAFGALPSLTINGGTGDDTVNFNGSMTSATIAFAANAYLDVDLQNDDPTPGTDQVLFNSGVNVLLSGSGTATVKVSRNINFNPAAALQVVNGNMTLEANQQLSATAGNFRGILVGGARLTTQGTGNINLKGKGGTDAGTPNHQGIFVTSGSSSSLINSTSAAAGAGTITIDGTGGVGTTANRGVDVITAIASITSVTGDITFTGQGGSGGTNNYGVSILNGPVVSSTGAAKITINGTGGSGTTGQTGSRVSGDNTQVSSAGGDISITGNGGSGTAASHGVSFAFGAAISATGSANIVVNGTGGSGVDSNVGVVVSSTGPSTMVGAKVTATNGSIQFTAQGGAATGIGNIGWNIDAGASVTGPNISIVGTGGSGTSDCYGVGFEGANVPGTGISTPASGGTIAINGTATETAGTDQDGVRFEDSVAAQTVSITTLGVSSLTITGTAGNSNPTSSGINIVDDTAIALSGANNSFIADTMDLGTSNTSVNVGANTLTLRPKTTGWPIDLGGADSATQLGLTDTELDLITAGTFSFGNTLSGAITVSAPISRATATNLNLVSAANIDIAGGSLNSNGGNVSLLPGTNVFPSNSGVDVTTSAATTLSLASTKVLKIVINSTTVDTGYTQLNVAGLINLNNANLALSGPFVPVGGESFTVVNNDGAEPIAGAFNGLAEGAVIPNFLSSGRNATISYVGGSGNDAVLSVGVCPTAFTITGGGDESDAVPGNGVCATAGALCTLRAAIEEANALPACGTIDINVNVAGSMVIANGALNVTHSVNINGPGANILTLVRPVGAPYRLFTFNVPTGPASINGITITGGDAGAANGGGILNAGPLDITLRNSVVVSNSAAGGGGIAAIGNTGGITVVNSTIFNNTAAQSGGGILAGPFNVVNLVNSTVSGNNSVGHGGGLYTQSGATIINSTVTNNRADSATGGSGKGGGMYFDSGLVFLRNTIVARNFNDASPSTTPDDIFDLNNSLQNTCAFNLIGDGTGQAKIINGVNGNQVGTTLAPINPMLAPLANNGGPTPTHATMITSTAVDRGDDCVISTCTPAVPGGALTTDQRGTGFPRQQNGNLNPDIVVDIGAYERAAPSASAGHISGQITDSNGAPVAGAAVRLNGSQNRLTVTDSQGNYHFDEVSTGGFYNVTPARPNFTFAPAERNFTQLGDNTQAGFTANSTSSLVNPLDASVYFVRQQYVDFLGREPDEVGLNFWVSNIESCGPNANCRLAKREDTSAAFFLSIEFNETGYLVYRTYQAAFGDLPGAPVPLNFSEFRADSDVVGDGLVVNATDWQAKLEANKLAYLQAFVARARFTSAYPNTWTPAEFVDRLFANAEVIADGRARATAIAEFGGAATSADSAARARALRRVAENETLGAQEFKRAFVLLQYYGYLSRDPNALPDGNFSGFEFWLQKLDQFNGDFRRAEMVKAFLVAGEYRARFPR